MTGEIAAVGNCLGNGAQAAEAGGKHDKDGSNDQSCRQLGWRRGSPVAMLGGNHRPEPIAEQGRVADDGMITRPERR